MSAKGKKAVSQEELRRLMKARAGAAERQKRIESPFAQYTRSGRLMCSVCGEQVKSEAVWQAHVLGRAHKERVLQIKQGGPAVKRKKEEEEEEQRKKKTKEDARKEDEAAVKKAKSSSLPADFFQNKSAAGLGLLAGQYGDEDDDDEEEEDAKKSADGSKPPDVASGLPADFFESSTPGGDPSESTEEEKKEKEKPDPQLPEGFFDDPVKDARVRNVDTPREQMDREWEEFQKEMRMVNNASDAIVAEDDEEGRLERQIDEIDEQIQCFRRVELLRAKQEAAQSRTANQAAEGGGASEGEEDEEEEEEELLHVLSRDWRAKGALA